MAKKKQPELWKEPPKKYDFFSPDYLIAEGAALPDILLYPEWSDSLMLQLGRLDMLTGEAEIAYNKLLNNGGNKNDHKA